ncbi:MAG TPA: flagellar hook-length control protein FliK [Candidatus Acidoferrales bacterium]|nr:flagellar hook-length control protein FliK [Candidatus Acidoferrales bacterium]
MISIASVLPAQKTTNVAGSVGHAKGKGKGGHWSSLFGTTLASSGGSSAGQSSSLSSSTTNADLIGQLTSLLQNGTPMATIVDQIAQSVGSSVAKQLAGRYSQSDLDRLRNTITQSIANALSPPSNAPPGSAAQEAAALAARLQTVVESIARDAESGSGQQNELSGNLLDADSAKELPAQQQTSGTSSTLDVSKVVRSLLASVIAVLNAPSTATPSSVQTQSPNVQTSTASSNPMQLATPAGNAAATNAQNLPQDSAPSTLTSGLLTQSTANAVGSQQNISMSNAPDLLARMLVRAADVDAQVNGSTANAAANATASAPATPALTPSMLAARLAALLADADGGTANASSSSGNSTTSGNAGHSFDQGFSQQSPFGANGANLISTPLSSPGSQAQNAAQTTGSNVTVDANDVIEQMVSAMSMRTIAQGTSEIRLQLQPENLGQVSMRLTVSGNQVSANVVAQNADVGNALVANHQELARSLSQAGLTLSGFSVDVSGGDAGSDQSKGRTGGFGRRYVVHELSGDSTAETSDASSAGPSLLSGSRLELFNSLA